MRSDHNEDITGEILKTWITSVSNKYHDINAETCCKGKFPDETGPGHWTKERFDHIIDLRESALDYARRTWADYVLVGLESVI